MLQLWLMPQPDFDSTYQQDGTPGVQRLAYFSTNIYQSVAFVEGEMPMMSSALRHRDHYDEAHFWLNGYVNKQNCRIWSEANPQVYVETPLHPEKLTVWFAL
ncbi:hypothetical protein TNCV_2491291 [Trichonephila clavipes]|nr:hypothetical protein TNCV_2491291 [Trichonephila clavipes]